MFLWKDEEKEKYKQAEHQVGYKKGVTDGIETGHKEGRDIKIAIISESLQERYFRKIADKLKLDLQIVEDTLQRFNR